MIRRILKNRVGTLGFLILLGFQPQAQKISQAEAQDTFPSIQSSQHSPDLLLLNSDGNQRLKESQFPTYTTGNSPDAAGHFQKPSTSSERLDLGSRTASIHGLRIEEVDKDVSYEKKNGVSIILADAPAIIRLTGERLTRHTIIRFVTEKGPRGSDCDDIERTDLTPNSAVAHIQIPALGPDEDAFYLCVRQNNTDMPWVYQGPDSWLQIKTYEKPLPLWAQIIMIIILLCLSGLFSGLNLGLMSLDRTEMKIIAATGTESERRYAKAIQPLRDNGNYLLCSLLLGNVLVNSTLTILLDDLSSGLIAVISSTISIVLLGEIVPQAICSRHGLAVGARTVLLTKLFMALTFPLSYPISVILDKMLGEEIGNVYNRDRLKELLRVTNDYNDLEKDEVQIIAGALELKQKVVSDVMTKLEDVFMLPSDAVLDFDTVSEIMSQGYSRVPIYEGTKSNIISVLYTKDLAFVDPDDKMPLRTICQFYSNPIMYVFENTTLDVLFRDFKTGNRGHMAFAQRISEEEKESDPYYEITGLVTMEDVIEALIQAEINDETDVYDNIRRRRSRVHLALSSQAASHGGHENIHVSPQLALAAFQYLSTAVEEFNSECISKPVLQRLLNQNVFFQIRVKVGDYLQRSEKIAIYEKGKPADYFVLILEGRVEVEMGKENLVFESGPFTFFGVKILTQVSSSGEGLNQKGSPREPRRVGSMGNVLETLGPTFMPDYTVRPVVDTTFLKISRSVYQAAKQSTAFERAVTYTEFSSENEVGENRQMDEKILSEREKASNKDFGRRGSLKGLNLPVRNSLQNSHSQSGLMSNRNSSPQSTDDLGKRNTEILTEILLRPALLRETSDKTSNFPTGLRRQSLDGGPTFLDQNKASPPENKNQIAKFDESIEPNQNRKVDPKENSDESSNM